MKRFSILLAAAITTTLFIAVLATSNFSADDKHSGHHPAKAQHPVQGSTQSPSPTVDGSVNPNLIPDAAAYEILFRLLSSTIPEGKKELRKAAYLKVAGFDSAEAAAISNAAYEYKMQIDPLDAEVDNIKNQHWPDPNQQVMNQLTQLQQKKESIIADIAGNLQSQLNHYNPAKLGNHITGEIKRKTKGFPTALPARRVGSLKQFFSNWFTVSAQAPGCDAQVYMYNNVTADMGQMTVYGNGSYSLPYNNCGHTITLSTQIWGPNSTYATGGDGTYLSLDYNGTWLDGYFMSTSNGEGYCSVSNTTFSTGSQTDDYTVEPYVQITRLYASDDDINNTAPVTLYAEVKSSEAATGGVTVQFGISSNPSPISFVTPTFPKTESGQLAGNTVTLQTTVTPPTSSTKKGPVVFYAGLSVVPTGSVANGPNPNVTVCFGPKISGTCEIH